MKRGGKINKSGCTRQIIIIITALKGGADGEVLIGFGQSQQQKKSSPVTTCQSQTQPARYFILNETRLCMKE